MKKQQGVALPVALILSVVMMVGAVYLARSATSSSVQVTNLAYQRSLTRAADMGLFIASNWLGPTHDNFATKQTLNGDVPAQGYVASYSFTPPPPLTQPLTPDDGAFWNGSVTVSNIDGAGTDVQYIIHRLCSIKDAPTAVGNQCIKSVAGNAGTNPSGAGAGTSLDVGSGEAYNLPPFIHYLVTSRVTNGKRGTSVTNQLVVMMGV